MINSNTGVVKKCTDKERKVGLAPGPRPHAAARDTERSAEAVPRTIADAEAQL